MTQEKPAGAVLLFGLAGLRPVDLTNPGPSSQHRRRIKNAPPLRAVDSERKDIMVRDLLFLVVASIAIVCSVFGSPQKSPCRRRLISERSESMRTER